MKVSFIAGVAVGYVLGARAGRERYEQIRRTSGKVWNSGPVQKQVGTAKEAARTKAAPMVADLVADAARATGEKLRSSRTVSSEAITADAGTPPHPPTRSGGPPTAETAPPHGDPWADATRARG
ncbi:MAG: protoporphyrinogen oxidase [Dermatophilaceae bacterium]